MNFHNSVKLTCTILILWQKNMAERQEAFCKYRKIQRFTLFLLLFCIEQHSWLAWANHATPLSQDAISFFPNPSPYLKPTHLCAKLEGVERKHNCEGTHQLLLAISHEPQAPHRLLCLPFVFMNNEVGKRGTIPNQVKFNPFSLVKKEINIHFCNWAINISNENFIGQKRN
jgi:hypothetical protein